MSTTKDATIIINHRQLVHYRQIAASLAFCAVRQIRTEKPFFPVGLENVVGFLTAMIRPNFDEDGYAELELHDAISMVKNALLPEPLFGAWELWFNLDDLIRNACLLAFTGVEDVC